MGEGHKSHFHFSMIPGKIVCAESLSTRKLFFKFIQVRDPEAKSNPFEVVGDEAAFKTGIDLNQFASCMHGRH